jgi:signal peptide peptidase SppA
MAMNKYPRIVNYVCDRPWAILEEKLQAITEFITLYANGFTLSQKEIEARVGERKARAGRTKAAVAVVPVMGVLSHRANLLSEYSGGTSTEKLAHDIRMLAANDSIASIVLDLDSEGGNVEGITELWKEIYDARQRKNVVAVANAMAASAAYWLGSAATEFVATPSGSVGSIGVLHVHAEQSQALEESGIKMTITKAGKYKGEGSPFEPLTDDAKDFIQGRVDEAYSMFVRDVAKGRGVTPSEVRKGYGQGRLLGAKEAKELGMIDRIATLDETISRLASKDSGQVLTIAMDGESLAANSSPTVIVESNSNDSVSVSVYEQTEPEPVAQEELGIWRSRRC